MLRARGERTLKKFNEISIAATLAPMEAAAAVQSKGSNQESS